jgi:hypothetical protein
MAQVLIRPSLRDYAAYPSEYESLPGELHRHGFDASVGRPEPYRGAGKDAVDVVIHLLEVTEDQAVGVLVGAVAAKLAGRVREGRRKGERRQAVIYGPDGKERLREFDLDTGERPPEK